ncbi:hypothetical protein ACQKTA_07120 [Enterococcus sp. 22-H-5-01]|uniref:hypothetical protein n=1 Tax=Enterococcus sp. 22-H-5-01 TaxID=3418555 RepID=UPI003CFD94FF
MPNYICDKKIDEFGRHKIHTKICNHLPKPSDRIVVGYQINFEDTLKFLAKRNPNSSFVGCDFCCPYIKKNK